jgi:hypothetical protein
VNGNLALTLCTYMLLNPPACQLMLELQKRGPYSVPFLSI